LNGFIESNKCRPDEKHLGDVDLGRKQNVREEFVIKNDALLHAITLKVSKESWTLP
jgi:hypothetical protein